MMEKGVAFTMKEALRLGIIDGVRNGKMRNQEAALALHLSIRQIIRIKKKVEEGGPYVGYYTETGEGLQGGYIPSKTA